MSERLQGYLDLLNMSYNMVVEALLEKYGPVKDDYYREASYNRFLKKEIKSIARGKYQRTSEGLYCHHIAENKIMNISDLWYIETSKIPFKYQQKDQLVYCDIFEHLVLHSIIVEETNGRYGVGGYNFIKKLIKEWYIDGIEPKPEWMKKCKERAFLVDEKVESLFFEIEKKPIMLESKKQYISYLYKEQMMNEGDSFLKKYTDLESYMNEFLDFFTISHEMNKIIEEIYIIRSKKNLEFKKAKEEDKRQDIIDLKLEFRDENIIISRQSVLELLYEYKYKDEFKYFEEFRSYMMPVIKDDLIEEFRLFIEKFN